MNSLISLCCALVLCLSYGGLGGKGDDSPGFFLRITKNIPRLGRALQEQHEYDFRNNKKITSHEGKHLLNDWLWNEAKMESKKRAYLDGSYLTPEHELTVIQPVNANTLIEMLNSQAIATEDVAFVHWKDFDMALQLDSELYAKVMSLGRKPDQRLKQELTAGLYTPVMMNPFAHSSQDSNFNNYPVSHMNELNFNQVY